MQLINGVPIDKERSKVLIGIQIWKAATSSKKKLPDSIMKSLPGYFYRCGE